MRREHRPISIAFMAAWLGAMIWPSVADRDIRAIRIVLLIAPLWTVAQVLMRLRHN